MNPAPRAMRLRLLRAGLLGVLAAFVATSVRAADDERNWELSVSAAGAYVPDYRGANHLGPRVWIWADGSYRTQRLGTFVLDSGSLTIAPEARWDFVDTKETGLGVLIGYRSGRDDRKPNLTSESEGSVRLSGMSAVSSAFDAGIAGHVTLGKVPVFAQVRSALNGSQGTIATFGVYLPWQATPDLEITVLPTVTWANAKQMRALYGVSAADAAASGFAPYDPGRGWENAAVEIGADWHVEGPWHVLASLAYEHLLPHAARSSIVQTASQPSALLGVSYQF